MSQDLIQRHPRLEALFDAYSERFGKEQTPYRNHIYRVINLVAIQKALTEEELEKVAIAGFFHDAGIWLAGTFDYLEPSARLAVHYLEEQGLEAWSPEIEAIILNHHKVTRFSTDSRSLAEMFRRADWIDVSLGLLRFGLPAARIRHIRATFPNAGFHTLLLKLSGQQLLSQPWRPLPMLRR